MSAIPEIYDDIKKLKERLNKYHDEMGGTSYGRFTITGKLETVHFFDHTAQAIDSLSDLLGIMEDYYDEE